MNTKSHLWQKPLVGFQLQKKGTTVLSVSLRWLRDRIRAQRGAVAWMVLSEVCVIAAVGLALSVPAAFAISQFLKSFLFGMKPNDPLTMAFAIGTLLISALLAGYLPARKASRIDPMIALRHE